MKLCFLLPKCNVRATHLVRRVLFSRALSHKNFQTCKGNVTRTYTSYLSSYGLGSVIGLVLGGYESACKTSPVTVNLPTFAGNKLNRVTS